MNVKCNDNRFEIINAVKKKKMNLQLNKYK